LEQARGRGVPPGSFTHNGTGAGAAKDVPYSETDWRGFEARREAKRKRVENMEEKRNRQFNRSRQ
jgi:hypothetical protein